MDVARDAMQMTNAGVAMEDIRTRIEQKYKPSAPSITPTPPVPPKK